MTTVFLSVGADTTITGHTLENRNYGIQIQTGHYDTVHLLLPEDDTETTILINNLISACTRIAERIRTAPQHHLVKTEPTGATSNAHTNPAAPHQPGPPERLKRGQTRL